MASARTVANKYAERLLAAKDKEKATRGILRRMGKLRYRGHTEPISVDGKKKIIGLIQAKVTEGSVPGTDNATYSSMIDYMLEQVGDGAK
ncbi:MAG: hypothetical protein M1132_11715 [Chloroflexi bacterium]|nr:hypothetical protein [Chloroflexota bacterium]MCL5952368.1 hypothetical protein [Chloroflexota bacterium]